MTDESSSQQPEGAVEHLHKAEQDLAEALKKEREAEREVAKGEEEVEEAIREVEHPREFTIEIVYDGQKKKFEVRLDETIKTVLDKAISAFGPLPNPHMLALFKDGKELADTLTVKEAGIKPHDVLLLRPSTVKGG